MSVKLLHSKTNGFTLSCEKDHTEMLNYGIELAYNPYAKQSFDDIEENVDVKSVESDDDQSNKADSSYDETKPKTTKVGFLDDILIDENSHENEEQSFVVERVLETEKFHRWYKKPSRLSSLLKIIVAIIFAFVTLFCVIASKFSIIFIASHVSQEKKNLTIESRCDKRVANSCENEVAIVMLGITMMIPSAFTFFKEAIVSFRKVSYPWPTKQAIFWGIFGTVLETIGVVLFLVGTIKYVKDTDLVIVLMNAMLIFPTIGQIWREYEDLSYEREMNLSEHLILKRRKSQRINAFLIITSLLLQIGGLCGILYLIWDNEKESTAVVAPLLSVTFIGIAWSPKIRELQIDQDLAYVCKDSNINIYQNESIKTRSLKQTFSNSLNHEEIKKQKKSVLQTYTSRGKAAMINSLVKLICIPIFITLFVYIFDVANIPDMNFEIDQFRENGELFWMFIVQILSSFIGYHVAVMCCSITLQRLCFSLPLTMSTPICVAIVLTEQCDTFLVGQCKANIYSSDTTIYAILSIALCLGQFCATAYYIWNSQNIIMAAESGLFWVPHYDGSFLEQYILLNRKNETTNEYIISYRALVKKTTIYICTTMYHEADYEMEQLLYSIAGVDKARRKSGRNFEAHIWFDDGVREKTLKAYAIQLVSLLSKTLEVNAEDATKLLTPYGMQLKWILPGGMLFCIHLKDNVKVKNKKRWSQVMYMSYVLDFKEKNNLDNCFILTTDADVKFFPEDVSALMDFMLRDPSVGAVCGRTHPMGSGPMVWFQKFDYAIGHWFLKVAEHVMGSVLCSPGCFSIYRCRAVEDVLPTYASSVECAMDFLKKDMGEDRWMCTLLIEHGWRLDYCASSSNATYCPETFEEFFKQRRRWGPSTLANQVVLIQSQLNIRQNNDNINLIFIFYQVFMLFSTLVGPSTVLLLIASGLHTVYPNKLNLIPMFFINLAVVIVYIYICLFHNQNLQLKVGLILTFIYSIIMAIVVVGLIILVVNDFEDQSRNGWTHYFINETGKYSVNINDLENGENTLGIVKEFSFRFTPPSIFLFFMIGLFLLVAALHGKEGLEVLNGIWYLLCIPSCYLFLMVYTLANITDRSWGTRENVSKSRNVNTESMPWNYILYYRFKEIFFCCFKDNSESQSLKDQFEKSENECESHFLRSPEDEANNCDSLKNQNKDFENISEKDECQVKKKISISSRARLRKQSTMYQDKFTSLHDESEGYKSQNQHVATPIEDWCTGFYSQYVKNFKEAGYDDTTFLMKIKEQDLINIGITNRGHRKQLLINIEQLPPTEIEQDVPENVRLWLLSIGLQEYWPQFDANSYNEPNALADLKMMDKETLASIFNIKKQGHLKKMTEAISQLKYSTSEQKKIRQFKLAIEKIPPKSLEEKNHKEYLFWDRLRKVCLLKEQAAFSQSAELHSKLFDLRNTALVVFGICNVLWLTVMLAIINQGDKLTIFKTSFLSVTFLLFNAVLMLIQFGSLLLHRISTWLHYVARTTFHPGSKDVKSWSFTDDELPDEPSSEEIEEIQKFISLKIRRRSELRDKQAMQRIKVTAHAPLFRTSTNL